MASMINTSRNKIIFGSRRRHLDVDGGTLAITGGTWTVDSGTLMVANGTRTADGNTLSVGGGT
jgi:hypothetical protein